MPAHNIYTIQQHIYRYRQKKCCGEIEWGYAYLIFIHLYAINLFYLALINTLGFLLAPRVLVPFRSIEMTLYFKLHSAIDTPNSSSRYQAWLVEACAASPSQSSFDRLRMTLLDMPIYIPQSILPIHHRVIKLGSSKRVRQALPSHPSTGSGCHPSICLFTFRNRHSAFRNPHSAIDTPHSAIRNPQSTLRISQSFHPSPFTFHLSPQTFHLKPNLFTPSPSTFPPFSL